MNNITRKIQHLHNTANHPNTPPAEAEAALAAAERLMLRHAIDESMLREAQGAQPDEIIVRNVRFTGKYVTDQILLMNVIARAYGVMLVKMGRDRATMVGASKSIEGVEQMFTLLLAQMTNEVARQNPPGVRGAQLVSFRTSFQKGWLNRVGNRLVEQARNARREATEEHGPGVGIMLADEAQRVKARVKQEFPHLRSTRSTVGSRAGRAAGSSAGERADIGNRRIAGRAALTR